MKTLLKSEKLILRHQPGKGAWTYHLGIPGTKDIRGSWGKMKVSGTIDGYEFKDINLAPALPDDEQHEIITTILSQPNESRQEQKIMDVVKRLS
ncbi:DUF1905 domain-containing protein [Dyadobacter sp. CY347]|uniref:DUF1905 domain-containing protein n=1 Tax=Dyadobacter sp. CY347 TaxID=2909336 RepID=UPI001F37CE77|nr:DUF1905 domain-containing protein [Dyadobacter sp. CY347]MCF2487714.1 DUF1905 domain-containing protein [Dyadobacter sp. CY347]